MYNNYIIMSYPTYSTDNGVGCITSDGNIKVGLGDSGIHIEYDILSSVKTFDLNSEGITWNDGITEYNTPLGILSAVKTAFQAVEIPTNSTTLQINDNLLVNNSSNLDTSNLSSQYLSIVSDVNTSQLTPTSLSINANQKYIQLDATEPHIDIYNSDNDTKLHMTSMQIRNDHGTINISTEENNSYVQLLDNNNGVNTTMDVSGFHSASNNLNLDLNYMAMSLKNFNENDFQTKLFSPIPALSNQILFSKAQDSQVSINMYNSSPTLLLTNQDTSINTTLSNSELIMTDNSNQLTVSATDIKFNNVSIRIPSKVIIPEVLVSSSDITFFDTYIYNFTMYNNNVYSAPTFSKISFSLNVSQTNYQLCSMPYSPDVNTPFVVWSNMTSLTTNYQVYFTCNSGYLYLIVPSGIPIGDYALNMVSFSYII